MESETLVTALHSSVPGRARLKVAGLQSRPDLKDALEKGLAGRGGILSVSASVVTSNVLVYYDPERELPDVIGIVAVTLRQVPPPRPRRAPVRPPGPPVQEAPRPESTWGPNLGSIFRTLMDWVSPRSRGGVPRTMTSRDLVRMATPEAMPMAWHQAEPEAVVEFWRSSLASGLDSEQARRRLGKYGPNVLPHPEPRSAIRIFLDQMKSVPVMLLLGSAAVSVLTGGVADAIAIGAVVLLNAGIGTATEMDAEKTLSALMTLSEPIVPVLRDGEIHQIGGEHIVPGDILILTRGCQVVADARLIETENLGADESALTGESMPVEKTPEPLDAEDPPLAERFSNVYRGTVITGGSGLAVVFATGRHTEIGRVQALINESSQPTTPLQRQMEGLGNQLLWFTGGVSLAVFAAGLLRGIAPLLMMRSAVSLAVAAIPEGLPTVATVSLASGVRSLARQQVLVRRLEAIEALGAVQVVCFDKTGTLTLNRMSAVAAYAGMRRYEISGGHYLADGKPVQVAAYPELIRLLEICALCSEAEIDEQGGISGSPTETALLKAALKGGIDIARLRRKRPVVKVQQRATGQNYMATTHETGHQTRIIAVKGSPSEVLRLCNSHFRDGQVLPLSEPDRRQIKAENDRMAGNALRVLGSAFLEMPTAQDIHPEGLVWTGLVGIIDPPRQGLKEVIADFRQAGVRPVMLTGDQSATAQAVGQALDLNGGEHMEALDSRTLGHMEQEQLAAQLGRVHIFSRVNPGQKLQIVRGFQQAGCVVGMTGDGINDGPALKAADVGIALGQSGTRVAREVSDIVLTDDNLQSLLPAIAEGRRIRDNIRKAIHFISATNLSEVMLMFTGIAAGLGEPLNPRQLLWINLITDVFPELALAVGPAEKDIMNRPPVNAARPVLGRGDFAPLFAQGGVMAGASLTAYLYGVSRYGISPAASTMAFLTCTTSQLLHGLASRTPGRLLDGDKAGQNPHMTMAVVAGFGMLALSQIGLAPLLGTVRIGLGDMLLCAGASAAGFLANQVLRRPATHADPLHDEDEIAKKVANGMQTA